MEKMKQLVRWRNRLVHDVDCNSLEDCGVNRWTFRRDYDQVKKALEQLDRPSHQRTGATGRVLATSQLSSNNEASSGFAEFGLLGALAIGAVAVAATMGDDDAEEERRRRRARGW